MASFNEMVESVGREVQELIDTPTARPSYMTQGQLELIMKELEQMERVRDSRLYCPGYPRAVVDGWDWQSPLGNRLMELWEIYRRL